MYDDLFNKCLPTPHEVLGLKGRELTIFAPRRKELTFVYLEQPVLATLVDERGVFSYTFDQDIEPLDYQLYFPDGNLYHDPYNFEKTISVEDEYYFAEGVHYQLYDILGSKVFMFNNVVGTRFSVWAPRALSVYLIADCNWFDADYHPMRKIGDSGIWELFIPKDLSGQKYKFVLYLEGGKEAYKTDPCAKQYERRPNTAAIVQKEEYHFTDHEWMERRTKEYVLQNPMNIYEVHLGSWKRTSEGFLNYRDLAKELADYINEMGYTHIELLPVCEHPLDESWGYQVTGYFAPTSRYGNLRDFVFFVNHMHEKGIGVILDWTPGHFPSDNFALAHFDGGPLYEKESPVMRWHPQWNTLIFNYGKKEVISFLLSSALFWLEKIHIDAIRVDAVQSMLYLDYAREDGKWEPNSFGGVEDLDAIEFLKHLNSIIAKRVQGALTIAEDASLHPAITKPLQENGLGFDLKWNLGWMNDTLRFLSKDPIYRKYHHEELLNSFTEVFRERYLLPLSHDEVVHEKKHLMSKMPLDLSGQFAHLRLCYSFTLCHPGKNLFFMGIELAQKDEWSEKKQLSWELLQDENHRKWWNFVKWMNHFYLEQAPLWQTDFARESFVWVHQNDADNSVIAYLRKGQEKTLLCVHNFTPTYFQEYFIPLGGVRQIHEILNTDGIEYGGGGVINSSMNKNDQGIFLQLAGLSTCVCEVVL